MQLFSQKKLEDGIYTVEIDLYTDGLTPVEKEVIENFGDPLIACGGTFTYGVDTEFILPANDKYFPTDFPVSAEFSVIDYPNGAANSMADAWKEDIKTKIAEAVQDLRERSVGLLGKEVSNIDTTPAP